VVGLAEGEIVDGVAEGMKMPGHIVAPSEPVVVEYWQHAVAEVGFGLLARIEDDVAALRDRGAEPIPGGS
jgi:hypothetical protein